MKFKKIQKIFIFIFAILIVLQSNCDIDEIMKKINELSKTKKGVISNYCKVKIEYYKSLERYRFELRNNMPVLNAEQDEWKAKYDQLNHLEKICNEKLDLLNKTDINYDSRFLNPNDKKSIEI